MIQVIDRAFDILEYVASSEHGGLSLKDISTHVNLNQATCANILKSLVKRNYIAHVGPKKGFKLGPMASFLIGNFSIRPLLVLAAKDTVDKLSEDLNENCLIGVLHHDKRILVYSTSVDHDLSVRNLPERTVYETATGKLLLAYLSEEEQVQFIERHGLPDPKNWQGVQTKQELLAELKKIKEKGSIISLTPSHVVGIAVPLYKNDTVVASLSTFLPESRFTPSFKKDIEHKLKAAATEISERLAIS